MDSMQEGNQSEDRLKAEGLGPKLRQDDVMRYCLLALDDATEKKDLDPLGWDPI